MKKILLSAAVPLALVLLTSGTAFADSSMMTSSSMSGSSMASMNGTMASANLMAGSRGDQVSWLQDFLVSKGYLTLPSGTATGYFGAMTKRALVQFQAAAGLPAHGYYGALTRAKIADMMAMNSGSSSDTAMTGVMVGGALMTPDRDIVGNAMNANNVTTLVAAVKAAGLVPTLEGAGPFTVFAPTNAAFAKLPAGTVDTLLIPGNKAKLVDILTYHVVPGRYTSADLKDGQTLTSVEGKMLTIHKSASGQITVNGTAMVETPDVMSKNGVTFVIDSVLMPQ